MLNTEKLKQQLQAEQALLEKELQELGVINSEVSTDWIAVPADAVASEADENIAADRSEDWQERRSEVAALETRWRNVKRSLEKITAGEYGRCEICQSVIETERLEANPAARTCMQDLERESELTL